MRSTGLVALGAMLSSASAGALMGFNYGATQTDGSIKVQSDFQNEFHTAKGLVGTNGDFTAARLYTNIQGGTTNTPTSAFPAAIAENVQLLLGIWASAGDDTVTQEIAAIKAAISQYGTSLTNLIAGISVGSEDLYRISPIGVENKSGVGADPQTIVNYINQLRSALQGTSLSGVAIGHVDTWTAWVNGSNSAVINACDWLGVDAYPYFQNTMANSIDDGQSLFEQAFEATVGVANGKGVWITETGWPVSGSTSNLAVPSLQNAKTYWDEVGCNFAFGKYNTFWFTLQDAFPTTPDPSFGVVGSTLSTTPLYDLSCSGVSSSSSASASSTAASSSSAAGSSSAAASASSSSSAASSSAVVPTSVNGGLTPSQGNGNGAGVPSGSASASGSSSSPSSGSSSSKESISPAVTTAPSSGGVTPAGNSTVSPVSPSSSSSAFTGAAAVATGHIIGGALAAIAVVAAAL